MMILEKIAMGFACYFAVILPLAVVVGRMLRGPVTPRPVHAVVESAVVLSFPTREPAPSLVA